MKWIISIISPVLLHMIVSEAVAAGFYGRFDSSVCTSLTALLVIPAALWMYRRDTRRKENNAYIRDGRVQNEKNRNNYINPVVFGLFCFVAGGIMNTAWSGILNLWKIQEIFSNRTQELLFAGEIAVQVIGLGMLVPIAEELIFRGLVYQRTKRALTVRQSVIFSALLFAVYHGNPVQMIFAFPMALVLAVVYERGNAIVFPVLFHMGANLTAVVLQYLK